MSESTAPLALEPKPKLEAAPSPPAVAKLGPLEWAAVVVAGNMSVLLVGFSPVVGRRFGAMFDDFGGRVPLLTSLVVRWYVPTLAGLVVASLLAFGLRLPRMRALLGVAAALGVVCFAACVYGIYAPIWSLSGAIKP
jgi:hypothetical protein